MARIAYCTPGLGPCGGVRVIVEHVNRLAARGHDVVLVASRPESPHWIKVDVPIIPIQALQEAKLLDAVVATGFQTVEWSLQIPARRRYYFVQMMEYTFFSQGSNGWQKARDTYQLAETRGFRVITIAEWLQRALYNGWRIDADIVPNGVNQEQFYPDRPAGRANAFLVEGDDRNQAKDVDHVSWRVALELRRLYGVELWGYSAINHPFVPEMDRHVLVPTTEQMRQMYSRCSFLLKASKYEGRACAPVEAMSCGTTTVRGIMEGDDDLLDGVNCLLTGYNYDDVLAAAKRLMEGQLLQKFLERGCLQYAKQHLQWDDKIDALEKIYGMLT